MKARRPVTASSLANGYDIVVGHRTGLTPFLCRNLTILTYGYNMTRSHYYRRYLMMAVSKQKEATPDIKEITQTRREREKLQRRESIINTAGELFYEKGYRATTMDEIARAAELSKGTLYLYFSSKNELYVTVVIEGFNILEERLRRLMASDRDVFEKGKAMFMAFVEHCLEHREYFRMTQYIITEEARRDIPRELLEEVAARTYRLLEYVSGLVQEGIDSSVIREDVNPMVFAVASWRLATGILDLAVVNDPLGGRAGPYTDIFERAVDMLITGAKK